MKLWQWAALLFGVGIVYVLVKRPTVPTGGINPYSSNDTNGTLRALLNFGTALTNKIGAPSANAGAGVATYNPGESFDDYSTRLFGPGTEG